MMIKKKRRLNRLILLVIIFVFSREHLCESFAASEQTQETVVKLKTAWSVDRARPGDAVGLALVVDIQKGFHINADARQIKPLADFKPYPTNVRIIEAHEGLILEAPRYPTAHAVKVEYVSENLMSFEGQIIILLPMKLEEQVQPGSAGLKIILEYQACAATYCLLPQKITLEESLPVAKRGARVSKINQKIFAKIEPTPAGVSSQGVPFDLFGWTFSIDASSGFGWLSVLCVAAVGGLLLNFTPCVLPIIPIKIISLSHAAGNRRRCFALGAATSLGVWFFWLVLGAMIALISDFTATNQLFQYPPFTIVVGLIIGTMAVGMFGSFALRLPSFIYLIQPEQNTFHGSFALGILAAILSTPCTAPFMGAAAAWATTQTPITTLSAFSAIGLGMGLPYLVLSAAPRLVEKMPKTGPASVLIKQVMGLLMLAAAAYFIGVGLSAVFSAPPNPPGKLYWLPVMGFIAAGSIWLIVRTLQITANKIPKVVFTGIGAILLGLSTLGAVHLTDQGPIDWVYYTPERFDALLKQNKVIVMVFTAEWCLNCKVLEEGVFRNPEIIRLFKSQAALPVKIDITGNNPAGKAKLKEVGNLTIPLLVIFSPDGHQVFKSDFYTVEQVLKAVNEAIKKAATTS